MSEDEGDREEIAKLMRELRQQCVDLVKIYQTKIDELQVKNSRLQSQLAAAQVKLITMQGVRQL